MSIRREDYYSEMARRLKALPGIKTFSRRLLHWNDVPAANRPALYLAAGGQVPSYETGRTVFWDLGAKLYLYVQSPDRGPAPAEIINPLLDAIVGGVFAPDNAMVNACTFGGLCHRIRLGNIETDEGTLGDQAVAVIPVTMTVMGTPI